MRYIIEENRVYVKNDQEEIIGEIDFQKIDENTYNITKTYVNERYRGQHIAKELVEKAFKEIKENRKCDIISSCSYCSNYLNKKS